MSSPPRRPDGFSGQTLLVVPIPLQRNMAAHPLLAGLHVTDAGFFPRAPGHFVERPHGSAGHVLIVCLRGAGWAEAEGRHFKLARGDVIGLRAGQPHRYGAEDADPWSIAWVHFAGHESDPWLDFAFGRREAAAAACHTPEDRLDSLGIDRVHAALETGYSVPELLGAAAALRTFLVNLSRRRAQNSAALSAQDRVGQSVALLREHWTQPHRVTELAAAAGLSVTHYTAIFRRLTGFSPIDFVLRLRIQHGARQVATSTATVNAIAAACGFSDPYYFTRCFTRIMGQSPRRYRRQHAG